MELKASQRKCVQNAAETYVAAYLRNVITTGASGTPQRITLDEFLTQKAPLRMLAHELDIRPEILLRDAVDREALGTRNVTFTEALEVSFRDLQERLDVMNKRLTDKEGLTSSYKDFLNDPHLSSVEKIMLVAILTTGEHSVEHVEKASGTLGDYMGTIDSPPGRTEEYYPPIDPVIFDKQPLIKEILVNSRFNGLVQEKGYFTTEEQRMAYFIDRIGEAEARQGKFKKGSPWYLVYEKVVELFNNIATLSPPGARDRIKDPQLKAKGLEELIDKIDVKKLYNESGFRELGIAAEDAHVYARIKEKTQGGFINGKKTYEALTVSFPGLHQLIGIHAITELERILIADGMGTGKTAQAVLAVPTIAQKEKRPVNALVVCPYGMLGDWQRMINHYLKPGSPYRSAHVIKGHDDVALKAPFTIINYEKLSRSKWTSADVVAHIETTNGDEEFEAAVTRKAEECIGDQSGTITRAQQKAGDVASHIKSFAHAVRYLTAEEIVDESRKICTRLAQLKFDILISDEADLARNPEAQRTSGVIELASNIKYYLELTGTPMPNSFEDMAKTIHLLKGTFRPERGFVSDFPLTSFGRFNPALLHATIGPRILRRKLSETADLEARLIRHKINVSFDANPAQGKAYLAVLRDGTIHGGEKLDLLRKISLDPQLAGEYYRGPMGASAKYTALFEKVDKDVEQKRQAIVYTVLRDGVTRRDKLNPRGKILIEQLTERYKRVAFIDGNVKQTERESILEMFQTGQIDVLLLTAQAMGRGIDLSAAQTIYHLEKTYLPDDEDQQNARAYRRGVVKNVRAYSLVIQDDALHIKTPRSVKGSLDEGIVELHKKRRLLGELLLTGATGWTQDRIDTLMAKNPALRDYLG